MVLRRDVLARENHADRLRQIGARSNERRRDGARWLDHQPLRVEDLPQRRADVRLGDKRYLDLVLGDALLNWRVRMFQQQAIGNRRAACMVELGVLRIIEWLAANE